MTTTTTAPAATDRLAGLLRLQEQQRADFVAELLDEEGKAAASILNDLRPDAGTALAEALEGVERQLREDRRTGRLLGRIVTELPGWMDSHFAPLDPDDQDAGRRAVNIYVARPHGDGHREPVALAVVDVSDAIYGRGARRRRDQLIADDQAAEARRDAAIARDREREAARR